MNGQNDDKRNFCCDKNDRYDSRVFGTVPDNAYHVMSVSFFCYCGTPVVVPGKLCVDCQELFSSYSNEKKGDDMSALIMKKGG
jgi:hypothetical protein